MTAAQDDNCGLSGRQFASIKREYRKVLSLQLTPTQSAPSATCLSEEEMTENFTAPFRLVDLPPKPLARVIQFVLGHPQPPKHRRNVTVVVSRKTLVPTLPPVALMQTCKHLADAAHKTWLHTGVFHLYLASWAVIDEDARLLAGIAGTTDLSITLDIRSGIRSRVAGSLESPLRASRIAVQIRALVVAMNAAAKIENLIIRVVQGKHASAYVTGVAMNAFRELRIRGRVHVVVQLNEDEKEINVEYGGRMKPELLRPGYLRQLMADIIGKPASGIRAGAAKRKYKSGKADVVVRRLVGGTSEGLQEGFDFDVMEEKMEMRGKMEEVYDWIDLKIGVNILLNLGRDDEEAEIGATL